MKDINSLKINQDSIIIDAIRIISTTRFRCLLVIGENDKFLGVLSEGDILRAISNGTNIYSSISNIYRKDFKYLTKKDNSKALSLFKQFGITLIPIVDKDLNIIEIFTLNEILEFIKFKDSE